MKGRELLAAGDVRAPVDRTGAPEIAGNMNKDSYRTASYNA
jgi:hypothetical protein